MPKCPNCGRETARTEDWACQWCGYPLLSESYKEIPKTFKQLKEERLHKAEPEPELAAGREEKAKKEAERLAKERARQEELAWRDAEKLSIERAKQEAKEARERTKRENRARKEAERLAKEKAKQEERAKKRAERQVKRETKQEPEPVVEPEPELAAEREPEPVVEPEPEPVATIIELNVEELSSAFDADRAAAHEKFTNSTIKLTGNVDRIAVNDINNNYYITLSSAEKKTGLRDVQCKFDKKHVPELKLLTKGETVIVQGKYAGCVIDIHMKSCTFVR